MFANDKQLTSYAISGYTMIPMEELTMFGNIQWVPDEAALKMQVSGLPVREAKQPVKPYITADDEFYPGTTVPNYTYATGVPLKDVYISPKEEYSSIVYVYEDTHSGEYAEFIDYIGYLWDNGWEDYETTFNNGKRTYYLLKNYKLISVVCNYSNNEIFIVVSY